MNYLTDNPGPAITKHQDWNFRSSHSPTHVAINTVPGTVPKR